ncbi:MAG: hypothetical protein ACJ8H8_00205 [Geminicoccaceae bacterium]
MPIKSAAPLDVQALHRARDRLVGMRTALVNQIRGFLLERDLAVGPRGCIIDLPYVSIAEGPEIECSGFAPHRGHLRDRSTVAPIVTGLDVHFQANALWRDAPLSSWRPDAPGGLALDPRGAAAGAGSLGNLSRSVVPPNARPQLCTVPAPAHPAAQCGLHQLAAPPMRSRPSMDQAAPTKSAGTKR